MKPIEISYFKHQYAEFILGTYEGKVCLVDYRYRRMRSTVDKRLQSTLNAKYVENENTLLLEVKEQLNAYFTQSRTTFDLPLLFLGSDFQKTVWNALLTIAYGQTISYQALANAIDNSAAVRAVANANGANSIGIIVPCHRVIASDGTLGGYGGGLALKKRLLKLESTQ